MILQALKEYYDRKAADLNSGIAPEGFENKEIPFLIIIKPDGQFVNLEDTREKTGNRLIGKIFLVPRSKTRTGNNSYQTTFLLWDHIGYLFGHPEGDAKARKQHQTWLRSLKILDNALVRDVGVQAILNFYSRSDQIAAVKSSATWSECLKLFSCNMTFRLAGDSIPIPCREAVQSFIRNGISHRIQRENQDDSKMVLGTCLITGGYGYIVHTHGRTPINKDTKSLVAIQRNSGYDSYGKEQCFNSPVCQSAEFAYTTGLNTLLKSKRQRIRIGDATVIFWSAKQSTFENNAYMFFTEPQKDDPDFNTDSVKSTYASLWNGTWSIPNDKTDFFILGLSPNAARISVRFWQKTTIGVFGTRLKQYLEDLMIVHDPNTNPALPIKRLLHAIAPFEDDDKLPPNFGGDMIRSILEGIPYPISIFQAAIRRIRSEQSKKDKRTGKSLRNVTYERAALMKAYLNRIARLNNSTQKEEIHVSLDPENTNVGYRLGRLFATLEKIQLEASPGINTTIRDRFYGAASSTPIIVFSKLMYRTNHHLNKLKSKARQIYFSNLLCAIYEDVDGKLGYPPILSLPDQGRFAIGYYHQMHSFFSKNNEI